MAAGGSSVSVFRGSKLTEGFVTGATSSSAMQNWLRRVNEVIHQYAGIVFFLKQPALSVNVLSYTRHREKKG